MEARLIGYDEIPTDISISNKCLNSTGFGSKSEEMHSGSVKPAKSSNGVRRMVDPTPQCSHSKANGSNSQAAAGEFIGFL